MLKTLSSKLQLVIAGLLLLVVVSFFLACLTVTVSSSGITMSFTLVSLLTATFGGPWIMMGVDTGISTPMDFAFVIAFFAAFAGMILAILMAFDVIKLNKKTAFGILAFIIGITLGIFVYELIDAMSALAELNQGLSSVLGEAANIGLGIGFILAIVFSLSAAIVCGIAAQKAKNEIEPSSQPPVANDQQQPYES